MALCQGRRVSARVTCSRFVAQSRHCEQSSDEAISDRLRLSARDCFAPLAMTARKFGVRLGHGPRALRRRFLRLDPGAGGAAAPGSGRGRTASISTSSPRRSKIWARASCIRSSRFASTLSSTCSRWNIPDSREPVRHWRREIAEWRVQLRRKSTRSILAKLDLARQVSHGTATPALSGRRYSGTDGAGSGRMPLFARPGPWQQRRRRLVSRAASSDALTRDGLALQRGGRRLDPLLQLLPSTRGAPSPAGSGREIRA